MLDDFVPWQDEEEVQNGERLEWVRDMTEMPLSSNLTPYSDRLLAAHRLPHILPWAYVQSPETHSRDERVDDEATPCSAVVLDMRHEQMVEHGVGGVHVLERRPRKGHKKSRRGCFSCKRRKIKVCSFCSWEVDVFPLLSSGILFLE